MEATATIHCATCGRAFVPRFRFQTETRDGTQVHYCSQTCREPGLAGGQVVCSVCGKPFIATLALHVAEDNGARSYFCSEACRVTQRPAPAPAPVHTPARAIAVMAAVSK